MNWRHEPRLVLWVGLGLLVCAGAAMVGLCGAPAVWADDSPLPTPTPAEAPVTPVPAAVTPGPSAWTSAITALLWVGLGAGAALAVAYTAVTLRRHRAP